VVFIILLISIMISYTISITFKVSFWLSFVITTGISFLVYYILDEANISKKQKLFEIERKRFISSDNHIYLKNFVSKYKTILPYNYKTDIIKSESGQVIRMVKSDLEIYINKDNIIKLKTLINNKGFNFDYNQIKRLIDIEIRIQRYEDFKTKILYNEPKELEDYIKNLIEIYGENYKKYPAFLRKLLKEKGVAFDESSLTQYYISDIKNKMELDRFEQELESKEFYFVSIDEVDSFTGYEFEHFLNTLFKKIGYSVEHTKLSGDQGADLIINKLGEKIILQAKRHTSKISNKAVQEVVASIKHFKADKGMVVTNNYFTNSAIELAKSNNIKLIDRDGLKKLIEKYL